MIRVLAVAALSLLAAGCGSDSAVQTRTTPGDIEATYAVHGDHLYLHCTGRGSPVVVLEAGLGGDHAPPVRANSVSTSAARARASFAEAHFSQTSLPRPSRYRAYQLTFPFFRRRRTTLAIAHCPF